MAFPWNSFKVRHLPFSGYWYAFSFLGLTPSQWWRAACTQGYFPTTFATFVCKLMDTVATSAGIVVAARFRPRLGEAVFDKQVGTVKVAERLVH